MKTLKRTFSTLLIFIAFKSLAFGIIFNSENSKNHFDKKNTVSISETKNPVSLNKNKIKNVMSIYNLPVVTILATKKITKTVPVYMQKNELIAHVDLPEIEITATKKTTGYKLRTICFKNGCMAVADLPEVVISQKRHPLNTSDCIASSVLFHSKKLMAVLYKGSFIPYVFLPTVEIKADPSVAGFASINEAGKTKNKKMPYKNFVKAESKQNKNLSLVFVKLSDSLFLEL